MTHRRSSAKRVKSSFLSCKSAIPIPSAATMFNLLRTVYRGISASQSLKETRMTSKASSSSRTALLTARHPCSRFNHSSSFRIRATMVLHWVKVISLRHLTYRSRFTRLWPRRLGRRSNWINLRTTIHLPRKQNCMVLKKFFRLVRRIWFHISIEGSRKTLALRSRMASSRRTPRHRCRVSLNTRQILVFRNRVVSP